MEPFPYKPYPSFYNIWAAISIYRVSLVRFPIFIFPKNHDLSVLDLSRSISLRHLKIRQAVTTMNSSTWALPELEFMLANFGSRCPLETLILTVRVAWGMDSSWKPLPQFLAKLLDAAVRLHPRDPVRYARLPSSLRSFRATGF